MLLSEAIDAFRADRLAKGYAKGTVRNEQSYLRMLLNDVGDRKLKNLGPQHLDKFWSRHSAWGPGTANVARAGLAAFFKWARTRGYMDRHADPLEGVRKRKVPPRDRIILPVTQFEELLATASSGRNRIILALGLYLFTRQSETTALQWQHIDFNSHTVTVHRQKTNTVDVLPMCEELELELRRWRLEYSQLVGYLPTPAMYVAPAQTKPKFVGAGPDGLRLVEPPRLNPSARLSNVSRIVKRSLASLGYVILDQEGGHTLRRSGAIALYNELAARGHDRAIRMCQAMLGHASIQTTEVYLRLDLDRKQRDDLIAGKRMFSASGGDVVKLERPSSNGEENTGAL